MKNAGSENNPDSNTHIDELSSYTIELNEKIKSANLQHGDFSHQYSFECGEFRFILPHSQAAEIIKLPELSTIPTTPDWFRGMTSVRGNVFPVFDLNSLLSKSEYSDFNWMAVFGNENSMAGLCINSLPVNIHDHEEIEPETDELPGKLKPFIHKTYKLDDYFYFEPDYEIFFNIFYESF